MLAVSAFVALGAARAQAAAAGEAVGAANRSNLELRVERELSVLPVLSAELAATWHPDGSLGLEIAAR